MTNKSENIIATTFHKQWGYQQGSKQFTNR